MRNRLCDLETAPHPDAHRWAEPVHAPSNYKDEEKIAAYIKEATIERDNRLGLDPDLNRIVALAYHDVPHAEPVVLLCSNELEEREALKQFWGTYAERPTRIIGYNSEGFDLIVLAMRSLFLDVRHPELIIRPSWKSPHVDIYQVLGFGGARRNVKGQRFYCERLGIPIYDDITGADVARMVAEGQWQKVHDHCLSDLGLLRALAEWVGVLPRTEIPEAPEVIGGPDITEAVSIEAPF
jgi:DNA polymerase elongation subunit (family B)